MTDDSRLRQIETNRKKYGDDHYRNMARKRWERPGEKERSKHLFNSETSRQAVIARESKKHKEGKNE